MAIDREEFTAAMSEIHRRLDDIVTSQNETNVELAEIRVKQDLQIIPTRPCPGLTSHMEDHKKNIESWKRPVIVGVVMVAFLFIQEPIKILLRHLFAGKS